MAIDKINATALLDGGVDSDDIASGAVDLGHLSATGTKNNTTFLRGDNSFQVVAVTPTAVSDQANTSTGAFDIPSGTTAQRPGSPSSGYIRMNTTSGSLEFYDGSTWIATNLIPTVDSVSGTIINSIASNLTLSLSNATDNVSVIFKEGSTTLATVANQTVSSGSVTVAVPSGVYGQTAGDTITISVQNIDGTPSSNSQNKTVLAAPSGGTISSSGSYRIHTFTSSGTFTNTLALSNVEYLVIAGGGGGASRHAGGGGAGGYRSSVVGQASGGSSSAESRQSISAGSYSVTVGAGGGAGSGSSGVGAKGSNSVFNGITSLGGGGGHNDNDTQQYMDGGSGGGASYDAQGGDGTAGQGHDGGDGYNNSPHPGAGGGGSSQVGGNGSSSGGGNGGQGTASNITGSSVTRAGGGGGSGHNNSAAGTGYHGGGNGSSNGNGSNATANTGGGGGGGADSNTGGTGGSGIVIIRYTI